MHTKIGRLFFCLAVFATALAAQSDLELRMQRVETGLLPQVLVKGEPAWTLAERMQHYKVPGVSLAIIHDFKIVWSKAYGLKDVETKEPVTLNTLFQAGSISKPVAAMVALKKAEQGKIKLDENINNKLTSWKLPDNEFTAQQKVTLANLLSHTAGLTVHGFPGYAVGEKLPTLPQVLDGAEPANTAAVRVNMTPGTKFRYSGGGTTIMQLALMDIEKKPFPQIAQETVLKRLEMTNSSYEQPLPPDWLTRAAAGYRRDGSEVEGKRHIYPEMAAAGLWTTPIDLAKFAIEIQLSLKGKSNKVLSQKMTEKMLTPFIEDFVALGFFIDKKGRATYFQHGGADEGFRAQLMAHKDKGYGAVVMVNSDNGQIMNEILRSIAKEYQWEDYLPEPYELLTLAPAVLENYTGRYLVNPDRVLTVTRENGRLFAEATQSPKVELLAIAENVFIRKDAAVQYHFLREPGGKVDTVKVDFEGGMSLAPRLEPEVMIPYENVHTGKFEIAVEAYRKIKQEQPNNVAIEEGRLNNLGYELLRAQKFAAAIAVFKLNVEFYPQSSNTYDSLGEGYMLNGDKELAIENYKKSLELDPQNKNAVAMLKKLQE
ncbi:penicillin-binding protein [candidate division KSB1 bacterium]|nr:MAG: penicillin-binding protein [candidate division KSB1 bacterium]